VDYFCKLPTAQVTWHRQSCTCVPLLEDCPTCKSGTSPGMQIYEQRWTSTSHVVPYHTLHADDREHASYPINWLSIMACSHMQQFSGCSAGCPISVNLSKTSSTACSCSMITNMERWRLSFLFSTVQQPPELIRIKSLASKSAMRPKVLNIILDTASIRAKIVENYFQRLCAMIS